MSAGSSSFDSFSSEPKKIVNPDKDLYDEESEDEVPRFEIINSKDYTEYVDTYLLTKDLRHMQSRARSRELVLLGYRGEIMTREQYEVAKLLAIEASFPRKSSTVLFSEGMKSRDPVLVELARRERLNAHKIIATIFFVKIRQKNGSLVSGYIDFEQSLRLANTSFAKCVNWKGVFQQRVKLHPSPDDLSYCSWVSKHVTYNDSDNWKIIHNLDDGLLFMHRGDHKIVCPDPEMKQYTENYSRSSTFSDCYDYCVFYDHIIRKKV